MSIHCSRPGICARSPISCFSFRSNCKDVRTSTLKDSISLWSYQSPSLSLSSLSTDDSRQDIGEEKSNFSSNLTHLWKDDIAAVLNRSLMSSSEGMMDSILVRIVFSMVKEDGGKTNRWKLQYPQTKKPFWFSWLWIFPNSINEASLFQSYFPLVVTTLQ